MIQTFTISSENFTAQVDSGLVWSAAADSLKNGYINIDRNKTGESITVTPEVFNDLDNRAFSSEVLKDIKFNENYFTEISKRL